MKTLYLTDDQVINTISDWSKDCDAKKLANFVGKIFGGDCEYNIETGMYEFVPNKEYMGAFGK